MAADPGIMVQDLRGTARLPTELNTLLESLYAKSPALAFGLTFEQFSSILQEIGTKYVSSDAREDPGALGDFFISLRVDDLVLARACAAGNDRAWEAFL